MHSVRNFHNWLDELHSFTFGRTESPDQFQMQLKKAVTFDKTFLNEHLQLKANKRKVHSITTYSRELFGRQMNEKYKLSIDITRLERRFVQSAEEFENFYTNSPLYKKALKEKTDDIFGEDPLSWYKPKDMPKRKFILHIGPPNSGKTYTSLQALSKAKSGAHLGPLRLLALEVYEDMNKAGIVCNLKTGEEEKKLDNATHVASTVELANLEKDYDVVVVDESQLIGDQDRGSSWLRAILSIKAKEVHVIASPNAETLLRLLLQDEEYEVVYHERSTELIVEKNIFQKNDIRKGDALIVFSRKKVLKLAAETERKGYKVSVLYGNMPPETRRKQVELFTTKQTDVIVSTDAIGMGLNLPIQRVVFLENKKFDGKTLRPLTADEIKQIAGRAGRKGMYEVGYVSFAHNRDEMERLLFSPSVPISKAYIFPPLESAVRFSEGYASEPMRKYFSYWKSYQPKHNFLKKQNLRQEFNLLRSLEGTTLENECTLDQLFPYLRLPISKTSDEIKDLWYQHVYATIFKDVGLFKPTIEKDSLSALELSYQKIGLHMMFLLLQDEYAPVTEWYQKREELAQNIFEELSKNLIVFQEFCRSCKTPLDWHYEGEYCAECGNTKLLEHFNSFRTSVSAAK